MDSKKTIKICSADVRLLSSNGEINGITARAQERRYYLETFGGESAILTKIRIADKEHPPMFARSDRD